jgi:hypothetical protein
MRRLINLVLYVGLLLFCLSACLAIAGPVTLALDYGTTPITGFRFYCTTAKPYTTPLATVSATTKSATVNLAGGLVETVYTCVARAYVASPPVESPDSNEITVRVAATSLPAPTNLREVLLRLRILLDSLGNIVGVELRQADKVGALSWIP